MSKFGLDEDDLAIERREAGEMRDRLAAIPVSAPRHSIDVAAMDAAASVHGFVSRENASGSTVVNPTGRRRRFGVVEPTRHLAIRLTATQYARFVAFADSEELTYHEALIKLLDDRGR